MSTPPRIRREPRVMNGLLPVRPSSAASLATPLAASLIALTMLAPAPSQAQPRLLSQTGLFEAGDPRRISADVITFEPRYPLWSDGSRKRRWMRLPAGRPIDARDPDAWNLPPGTRLWKEFALDTAIETRYIERRRDGQWIFASYVWRTDGSDAELAPADGVRLARVNAPQGRYDVPSRADCLACHANPAVPVLGVSTLQLGSQSQAWAARGWIRGLPPALLRQPPEIAAASEIERAARGYLHGNCGHCHQPKGVPVPLHLAERVTASAERAPLPLAQILERMRSLSPITRMPPLGTRLADPHGLAVVQAWLALEQAPPRGTDSTNRSENPR